MSSFRLDKLQQRFEEFKKTEPVIIGNLGQRFFVDSFQKQAWDGQLWEPRKGILQKDGSRKPNPNTNQLLIGKSGGKKRSSGVHLRQAVNTSLKKSTFNEILYSVSTSPNNAYPIVHNEGLKAGRGIGFAMPRRQFIGITANFIQMIKNKWNEDWRKALMTR